MRRRENRRGRATRKMTPGRKTRIIVYTSLKRKVWMEKNDRAKNICFHSTYLVFALIDGITRVLSPEILKGIELTT
jgi:hypothetical protein